MNTTTHRFLNSVQRPSRYIAGEFNQKPIKSGAPVQWCFAFPDVYEIAMSYTGVNILYGILNTDPRSSCERVFTPWIDAEKKLRQLNLPLGSLETGKTLREFDVLGITLQHEMNFTNVLTLLELGGIPIFQKDRTSDHALVIGGGTCVYNPEPLADFFDCFVIGDGEEIILEINAVLSILPVHTTDRLTLLRKLAEIPGIYVPSLYQVDYHSNGTVAAYTPLYPEAQQPVVARKVQLAGAFYDTNPLVPSIEIIHDRVAIEILRGCTRGCRFCQAGYVTRPIRERPSAELVRLARESLANTGYDNLSLLSLSSADHKDLMGIVDGLLSDWEPGVGISLPSLRIDGFDQRVAERLAELHQTSFTFAPEAGSQRLRKVISKDLGERQIFSTLEGVFQKGWQTIKLYFQMGLPTETQEDLNELVSLVARIKNLLLQKVRKKPKLNVSVNPHVPKPFTPFQWFGQDDVPTLKEKISFLKNALPKGPVQFSYHDPEVSMLEGVLARGDRKVGSVIYRAWQLGCRFDDWSETFHLDLWQQAFQEVGIDPAFYCQRSRSQDEIFPWEIISCGVTRDYLWLEWNRALKQKATYDCRDRRSCTLCGICDEDYRHDLYPPEQNSKSPLLAQSDPGDPCFVVHSPAPESHAIPSSKTKTSLRLSFSKKGPSRWLSQLDLQKTMLQIFRRAALPLAVTQGYHPRPSLSFAMGLPVGVECEEEWLDVEILNLSGVSQAPEDIITGLNQVTPPGLKFLTASLLQPGTPSLAKLIRAVDYHISWLPDSPDVDNIWSALNEGMATFHRESSFPVAQKARNSDEIKVLDAKKYVTALQISSTSDPLFVKITLNLNFSPLLRPVDFISELAQKKEVDTSSLNIIREKLHFTLH